MIIDRRIANKISESISSFPVVGILGPRQVGKTTLAKQLLENFPKKSHYLDLELPSDLKKLEDPELFLRSLENDLVVLDEIQRLPSLFAVLRAIVDKKRSPGRFLILGSASPDLVKQSSESLAGRIVYHELKPFLIEETGPEFRNIESLWLRGGYPLSFLADSQDSSFAWRAAFIHTYLERDLPQLGVRVPAVRMRRFWMMLAHWHGRLLNASQIADSLGVSAPAVAHYLDILEDTFIVRRLWPFYADIRKRLVKSPRVYIRDSGLLHALLNLRSLDDLLGHPLAGMSWEGFIIEQVLAALPPGWEASFYRTSAGAEIDLVLAAPNRPPIPVEIKFSSAPTPNRGFWTALGDIGAHKAYVVYPGTDTYPLRENVTALPASKIGDIFIGEG